uniref:Uncharacterized protein n=1 Tax=Anopheles farauti TaxID=69004 RepID=A0A182Q1D7_9DIPT
MAFKMEPAQLDKSTVPQYGLTSSAHNLGVAVPHRTLRQEGNRFHSMTPICMQNWAPFRPVYCDGQIRNDNRLDCDANNTSGPMKAPSKYGSFGGLARMSSSCLITCSGAGGSTGRWAPCGWNPYSSATYASAMLAPSGAG